MKHSLFIVILLLSLTTVAQNFNPIGQFKVKDFKSKDYESAPQNWAIIQDNDGVMLFANNAKILTYDGFSWSKISMSDASSVPRSMAKDQNGTIYVGGTNEFGMLYYDNQGKYNYEKISEGLENDSLNYGDIWTTYCYGEYSYFFSRLYIFKYHTEKKDIQIIKLPKGYSYSATYFFEDNIIIGTEFSQGGQTRTGDFFFNGSSLKPIKNSISSSLPALIFEIDDDIFILNSKGKPYLFDRTSNSYTPSTIFDQLFLNGRRIKAAKHTDNGFFLAVEGKGLFIFNNNGDFIRLIDETNGLSNLFITDIELDHHNNVWLTYDNGIGFIEMSSAITELKEELDGTGIAEDILSVDSTIYLATHVDFYEASVNNPPLKFGTSTSLKQEVFSCKRMTFKDGESHILIVANTGIYSINEKNKQKLDTLGEDLFAWNLCQSTSNPNLIYVAMAGIGADIGVGKILYKNGQFEYKGTYPNTNGVVRSILEKNNVIYYGTKSDGVYKIEPKNEGKVTRLDGLIKDSTAQEDSFQICEFQNQIYVGSGNGLYKIVDDKLLAVNAENYILNKKNLSIHRIRNTDDEKLWLVVIDDTEENKPEKITVGYLIKNENNKLEFITEAFSQLSRGITFDIEKDINGSYWFAGSDIVSVYNSSFETTFDSINAPIISKILVSDSTYIYNPKKIAQQNHSFDFVHNALKFEFTSTTYFDNSNNEFSWYLEGLEKEQTSWRRNHSYEYPRLSHGNYTFHLKSRNFYGYESPETTFSFTINPPWYMTWWAYLIYFVLGAIIIYLIILLAIRRVKRQNDKLEEIVKERTTEIEEKNSALEHQKAEIQEKTNDILDSIIYAKRIQNTILPTVEKMKTHFQSEHFVLYKPKDIVSGDFYWTGKVDNKTIFAAIDCTGHGVPGAFVSIVGFNGMNRAINEFKKRKPGEILDKLRDIVVDTFSQSGSNVSDGMDIALCSLDYETNKLEYAGAHNPLVILRGEELIEIKANKQPIGEFEKTIPFDTHVVEVQKGDCIYLYSDGYADQFGGEKGKKLKTKNLKSLLRKHKNETMSRQKELLDEAFELWKGDYEQLDDVCIIGVKI